jgi:hypothetical protein
MHRHDAADLVMPTLGESRQCGGQRLSMTYDKNHQKDIGGWLFWNKVIFSRRHLSLLTNEMPWMSE